MTNVGESHSIKKKDLPLLPSPPPHRTQHTHTYTHTLLTFFSFFFRACLANTHTLPSGYYYRHIYAHSFTLPYPVATHTHISHFTPRARAVSPNQNGKWRGLWQKSLLFFTILRLWLPNLPSPLSLSSSSSPHLIF